MQDVAQRVGVSKMAVSLALRGDHKISAATSEKIRAAAKEMGYVPDPVLRALNVHKQQLRMTSKGEVIAVLDYTGRGKEDAKTERLREAIVRSARMLGYSVDRFSFADYSTSQLQRILQARGIRSLILMPDTRPTCQSVPVDFDWSHFSVVHLGRCHPDRLFPSVCFDQFGAMQTALTGIYHAGYVNPVYVQLAGLEKRFQNRYSASFESCVKGQGQRVFLAAKDRFEERELLDFLNRKQPDVVIATDPLLLDMLERCGWYVPEKTGFVCLECLESNYGQIAGVELDADAIGHAATEMVDKLMRSNGRGIIATPNTVEIGGRWLDGQSLPGLLPIADKQTA